MYIDAVKGGDAGYQAIGARLMVLLTILIHGRFTDSFTRLPEVGQIQRCLAGCMICIHFCIATLRAWPGVSVHLKQP